MSDLNSVAIFDHRISICDTAGHNFQLMTKNIFPRPLPFTNQVFLTGTIDIKALPFSSLRKVSLSYNFINRNATEKKVSYKVEVYYAITHKESNPEEDSEKLVLFNRQFTDVEVRATKDNVKEEGTIVNHTCETPSFGYNSLKSIYVRFEENLVINPPDSSVAMFVESQMQENFTRLYEDDSMKDVRFIVEGEPVMAHRLIVMTRNKVMRSMLESDMKEGKEGVVLIEDTTLPIFKSFLKYLYTDIIDNIEELAEDLIEIADKYDMECLKNRCEDYLCFNIKRENIIRYLIKAYLYNGKILKDATMSTLKYCIKEISQTEEFSQLNKYPELQQEIIVALVDRISISISSSPFIPADNNYV